MDPPFLFLYIQSSLSIVHSWFCSSPMDSSFFAYSVDSSFLHISIYSFFIPSVDSLFLCLCTHSLYILLSTKFLALLWTLAYLFQIIIILQDSSVLQPSYYYHLSNLYITCITSFVPLSCILYLFMYPYTQQNTFIFYRRFKSMSPISFPLLIYSHLYSSILFSTIFYITNLIILGWFFTFSFPSFTHLLQRWITTSFTCW